MFQTKIESDENAEAIVWAKSKSRATLLEPSQASHSAPE
jgi:hypothetical protein